MNLSFSSASPRQSLKPQTIRAYPPGDEAIRFQLSPRLALSRLMDNSSRVAVARPFVGRRNTHSEAEVDRPGAAWTNHLLTREKSRTRISGEGNSYSALENYEAPETTGIHQRSSRGPEGRRRNTALQRGSAVLLVCLAPCLEIEGLLLPLLCRVNRSGGTAARNRSALRVTPPFPFKKSG